MGKMKDIDIDLKNMEDTREMFMLKFIVRGICGEGGNVIIVRDILIEDWTKEKFQQDKSDPPTMESFCFECNNKFSFTEAFEKDYISSGMCPSCFAKATNKKNWEE